jgi:hypothetical protein
MHVVHDRDNWWLLVNMVMASEFHKRQRISCLSECLLPSPGLCHMEQVTHYIR